METRTYENADEIKICQGDIDYRGIVKHINDGVVIIRESKIVFANDAFFAMSQKSPELVIKSDFSDFINPEDRERVLQYCRERLFTEGLPDTIEFTMPGKNGSAIIEMKVSVVACGGTPAILGALTDITERRKTRFDLQKIKERLESILHSMNEVVVSFSVKEDYAITSINPAAEALYGVPLRNFTSGERHTVDFVHPEDIDKINRFYLNLPDAEFDRAEYRIISSDGRIKWVLDEGHVVYSKTGSIRRIDHVIRDITEEKKAADALRESEEKYRDFFDSTSDMAFILTPEGVFIDINEAGLKLLGFENRDEALASNVEDFYVDVSERTALINEIYGKGHVEGKHVKFRNKAGEVIEAAITARAKKDESGRLLYHEGLVHNITKALEDQRNKVLRNAAGSMCHYLNPYIAVARSLMEKGHSLTIATCELYRQAVEKAGIHFHAVRPDIDPDDSELVRRVMEPKTGAEVLIKEVLLSRLRESYEDLLGAAIGSDLLVTHPITFAGPLVAEKIGIPWVSTVLAPLSFFSAYDLPVFSIYPHLKKLDLLKPWTGKLCLKYSRFVTRDWSAPVREIRSEIGLPPGKDPIYEGQFSPDMTLGLFSPLLAHQMPRSTGALPPPDWPQNTRVTGFIFYDKPAENGGYDVESDRRLEKFLKTGPPPVVFTLGSSAVRAGDEFYRHSFEAARRLGIRAILLTGKDKHNIPAQSLPDEIAVFDYIPYSKIFPKAAAVVHHGGVGTTAQTISAGRPMLVVPFNFDQHDNAFRITRLGLGRTLYRNRYSARRAAKHLKEMLSNPAYSMNAQKAGMALRFENGLQAACNAIDELAHRQAG